MRHAVSVSVLFGALAIAALSEPRPATAQSAWCSQSYDRDVGTAENCGFASFEQCMATAQGMGALCTPNRSGFQPQSRPEQEYVPVREPRQPRRHRR